MGPTQHRVRPATTEDVATIEGFGAVVVPETYVPLVGEAYAAELRRDWWSAAQLRADVERETVLLAVDATDTVIGVCHVGTIDDEPVMWKLYVSPDRRGAGLGRELVAAAVATLPAGTVALLTEHIVANVRAAAFYEREGFELDPSRPAGTEPPATVWRRRSV